MEPRGHSWMCPWPREEWRTKRFHVVLEDKDGKKLGTVVAEHEPELLGHLVGNILVSLFLHVSMIFNCGNSYMYTCPRLSFLSFFLSCFLSFFLSFFFFLSFCLSVCLSVFLSFCLSVFLSFCLSVFLSFCLSFFLFSFFLSVCLSFCLSFFLSFCLSVFLSFCLSVFLSFCLSVFLSFCLTVFLSFCRSVFLSFCLSVFLSFFLFFSFLSRLGSCQIWSKTHFLVPKHCFECEIHSLFCFLLG